MSLLVKLHAYITHGNIIEEGSYITHGNIIEEGMSIQIFLLEQNFNR